MRLTNKQIKTIVVVVYSLATIITAMVFMTACTMSFSVSKNNQNSTQKTEQTTTSSVDSTQININQKNKNHELKGSI